MPKPKLKTSEIVHEGYCTIIIDQMKIDGGSLYPYTRLEFGFDATAVLALTKENKLVINKEYRYPANAPLFSASGGKIDEGETPLQGAKRELLEETGYGSEEMISLGALYPFPALSSQKIHYFLAKNAIFLHKPTLEPLEQIETLLMTEEALQEHIRSGSPVDGILCTALYLKSMNS